MGGREENVHGREPDDIDPQVFDVVNFGDYAGDVAQSIFVGVFVAGGVNLVDNAVFPPDAFCDCHCCCCGEDVMVLDSAVEVLTGS